jgi:hypothetical protein
MKPLLFEKSSVFFFWGGGGRTVVKTAENGEHKIGPRLETIFDNQLRHTRVKKSPSLMIAKAR